MAKNDPSVIENYFDYGFDLHHRRLYFGSSSSAFDSSEVNEFNESNINNMIRAIDKMLDFSNKPIEIHMSSFGGYAEDLLALYDKILESPCQFIFYSRGKIMSCATWIMCICDVRYLSQNSTIMVHHGSMEGISGNLTDIEIGMQEAVRLKDLFCKFYAENSFFTKTVWEDLLKRDLYLTAEETIQMGLADKIVPHKKRGNFRRGPRADTFNNPPHKNKLKSFIKKLAKRIQLPSNVDIKIDIPEEKFEIIEVYDNTKQELANLNTRKVNDDTISRDTQSKVEKV